VVAGVAYDTCLRLARAHYENFPVASRLLPAEARPHIAAVYAFARIADDFADEGDRPVAERLALLDGWRDRLRATVAGRPVEDGSEAALVFQALGDTMRRFSLEPGLFEDLLSAFRQDVTITRYATWSDLLDYARRSANPVGRLVLRIAGYRDASMDLWSDAVCTALQFTNFWQDLERDWRKGRVYVPQETLARAGADERDLDRARWTPEWRAAMTEAGDRTRRLFEQGRPIADAVSGRLRWELRATWLGGVRILDRLAARGYDVFEHRPRLGPPDLVSIGWRTLTWRPMPAVASR
jgi:phytoene synthase